jgi:ABC-type transport system involved in Fe-S cluster assembly fused permease/ATPase subunit
VSPSPHARVMSKQQASEAVSAPAANEEAKKEEEESPTGADEAAVVDVDPETDPEAGFPAVPLDDPERSNLRQQVLMLNGFAFILWVGLAYSGTVLINFSPYDMATSAADVVVLDLIRALLVLAATHNGTRLYVFGAYALNILWLSSVLTAKLWVYEDWHNLTASTASVIFAPLAAVGTLILMWRITTLDTPGHRDMRFKSMMTILRPYFNPKGLANKFYVSVTWGMLILSKVCTITAPIYLGRAVTKITSDPPVSPFQDIAIYAFLQFIPRVCSEIQDVLYVKVWQVAYIEAADITFRHLHSLSLDWHLRKKLGSALRSMDRGLEAADTFMSYMLLQIVPTAMSALVAFIVFSMHFQLKGVAAVCHIGLAFYFWGTYAITIWRSKFNEEMNTHDNDMHEKATDSLVNFETVKYFSNEEFEAERYIQSVRDFQRMSYKTQWAISLVNVAQTGTIQLCMLAALALAAKSILDGTPGFGPGEFVAVQAYVLVIFAPLSYLGYMYTSMVNSLINMQNLSDLLNEKADIVDHPSARPLVLMTNPSFSSPGGPTVGDATIVFNKVRFRYPSQRKDQGLHDVSFTIPAGTTTAVVGKTGSGKTTLSRLLFRFYDLQGGSITIGGHDITKVTQHTLRKSIGMVPQDTCMFNDTVRFNIAYGRPTAKEEQIVDAARKAMILPFIENLSEKWDTVVGERGLKLSGGEKQRVAIARCLLKNPPIVVLDEATSALDNNTEREVQSALKSLGGRTTLIIAHRLTTVQHADQILVMDKGRIVERGTHEELLAIPNGVYASLWHAQTQAPQSHTDSLSQSRSPAGSPAPATQ